MSRRVIKALGLVVLLQGMASLLWAQSASEYARTSERGAVATVHPLATAAAFKVLEEGGNALDAAVAAGLTLGVVDGHNSGIGGGNFALVHLANGEVLALDGRETAPASAHRDMYLRDGKAQPALSKTGALAVGVPGSVKLYDRLLQHGKRNWAELAEPAAVLAEQGFAVDRTFSNRLQRVADTLRQFPATATLLLNQQGQPLQAGEILRNPDLAKTYRGLAREGEAYFYRGEFARAVDNWMAQNGGLLRLKDFQNYRLQQRQAIVSEYRGYQIYGFPPPSSGGVHVAQILNMLAGFPISEMSAADRYHVLAEAMKRAFADRAHYLGDPDFVAVPQGLLAPAYARSRAADINMRQASRGIVYGIPDNSGAGIFGKHTTHIATADSEGNWVAITTTVNTSFGSKVVVPGTGVILNNQMDDFSIQPGVPNAFGLVGSEANAVAANKRPLSSMSPTLVMADGKPVVTLGAAGGPTIITQVVQALVNLIDLGMSPQAALAQSRVHHQWAPDMLFVESSLPADVVTDLQQRGHRIRERSRMGATQMIQWQDGKFIAVSEPRIVAANLAEKNNE